MHIDPADTVRSPQKVNSHWSCSSRALANGCRELRKSACSHAFRYHIWAWKQAASHEWIVSSTSWLDETAIGGGVQHALSMPATIPRNNSHRMAASMQCPPLRTASFPRRPGKPLVRSHNVMYVSSSKRRLLHPVSLASSIRHQYWPSHLEARKRPTLYLIDRHCDYE